jgi:hypothetical protein
MKKFEENWRFPNIVACASRKVCCTSRRMKKKSSPSSGCYALRSFATAGYVWYFSLCWLCLTQGRNSTTEIAFFYKYGLPRLTYGSFSMQKHQGTRFWECWGYSFKRLNLYLYGNDVSFHKCFLMQQFYKSCLFIVTRALKKSCLCSILI